MGWKRCICGELGKVFQEKRVNLKNDELSGGSSQVKISENDRCGHSCRCHKW